MEFQLFRRFTQHHELDEISKILELQNVRFKILKPESQLGSSFGNTNQDFFELYIRNKDFALVKQILKKRAEEIVQSISEDYYLFTFKDSELQDILSNPDDWNEVDVMLSSKILNERGSNPKSEKIASAPPALPLRSIVNNQSLLKKKTLFQTMLNTIRFS